jgi:hypothetical protein
MKSIYKLKFLLLMVMMIIITNARATQFTVPDGATDTELSAVLSQATTGDVILINGWVTINTMVNLTQNVTIKAGVSNAGFDGQGLTRLFEIHPDPVSGAKLVFDNLGFIGGNGWKSDPTDGGVARIYSGVTEFIKCYFDGNRANRGGAFMITEDGTTVTFLGCEATNNLAAGNGNESRGGYLFTDGITNIDHEYCKISGNQSIGGRGGALCLFGNGTRRFFYTIISDNKGGNWGPDPTGITSDDVKIDKDGNPISDGEYEGAVAFITGGATTFESCGIIANKSWSHSGIIRGWGDEGTTVTFINTTLAKNQSLHDRSPLWIGGNAVYTFVNSLLVDNLGQNAGNGAGFDFDGGSVHLNIFNSIFARNVAGNDGAVDIRNGSDYAAQLTVKNTMIGLIQGKSNVVVPVDNSKIPTKSNIAMYKIADEEASLDYTSLENSGVDFAQGLKYSKSFGMPYYLLTSGSPVTKLGDPALLADYDLTTDLFDQNRPTVSDGSTTAAPTIASIADEFDDTGWDKGMLSGDNVAASLSKEGSKQVKLLNSVVSNGIIGVDFGSLRGKATAELYSISGQKVETIFSGYVVSKGYYNLKTSATGLYILKIQVENQSFAEHLILK